MALLPVHVRYVKHGECEITVDGTAVTGAVREMTFNVGAKDIVGTLTLSLCAPVLEVDGKQQVRIDDKTAAALIALGWTPPADEPTSEVARYPRREINWTSATGHFPRHDNFEAKETDPVVGGTDAGA